MLVRLRPSAFARVDHEQEEVDPGRARDHGAHEPLVARDVDEREPRAVRELQRRVAELDRDPALALFGEPVGVLAGQRPHEPRLAVVDVARGPDRERHQRAARTAAATSSTSSSSSVRQSRSSRPSRTIPTTGGDPRGAVRRAPPRPRTRSSAAPRAAARRPRRGRRSPRPFRRRPRRAVRLARAPRRAARAACGAPAGMRSGASRCSCSVPSSAAIVSLSARSARCSGCRRSRSTRSARPATIPACGPPSSLSPLKQTRSAPAASASRADRLVRQSLEHAGAEVVDERQLVPPRDGRELLDTRLLGEADDAEVRLVHAKQNGGVGADRALVVGCARAVRRSDLDEARTGAGEHVGDAKAVADLDQLAARDDHLATLGERGEGEQHRRRVVVHDERGLRAGQPPQDGRDVVLARPARPRRQVELEVRVAARGLAHVVERGFGERRPAEVRVDDHAGRVEHARQRRRSRGRELVGKACLEVAWVGPRLDLLARPREHCPGGLDGQRVAGLAGQLVDRRQVSKAHGRSVSPTATFDPVTELATRVTPRTWPRVSSVLVAALLAAAVMPYVRAVPYRGEALPGTSVAGVDVAGVGRAEAVSSVQAAVLPSLAREVELRAGGTRLTVRPSELYALNAAATADAVLAASRRTEPDRVAALVGLREVEVSPVLVERPKAIAAFLARVRSVGGESATAATVAMDGLEPTVTPSREGLRLDSTRLLADVRSAAFDDRALSPRTSFPLPRATRPPTRSVPLTSPAISSGLPSTCSSKGVRFARSPRTSSPVSSSSRSARATSSSASTRIGLLACSVRRSADTNGARSTHGSRSSATGFGSWPISPASGWTSKVRSPL